VVDTRSTTSGKKSSTSVQHAKGAGLDLRNISKTSATLVLTAYRHDQVVCCGSLRSLKFAPGSFQTPAISHWGLTLNDPEHGENFVFELASKEKRRPFLVITNGPIDPKSRRVHLGKTALALYKVQLVGVSIDVPFSILLLTYCIAEYVMAKHGKYHFITANCQVYILQLVSALLPAYLGTLCHRIGSWGMTVNYVLGSKAYMKEEITFAECRRLDIFCNYSMLMIQSTDGFKISRRESTKK
jgi:hypothetical protein